MLLPLRTTRGGVSQGFGLMCRMNLLQYSYYSLRGVFLIEVFGTGRTLPPPKNAASRRKEPKINDLILFMAPLGTPVKCCTFFLPSRIVFLYFKSGLDPQNDIFPFKKGYISSKNRLRRANNTGKICAINAGRKGLRGYSYKGGYS